MSGDSNMRIAVCLSGHSRYFNQISLPNLNVDYFISTYNQDGYQPKYQIENPIAYHFFDHVDTNLINVDNLINKFKPKLILLSDDNCIELINNKFSDTKTYADVIIRNVVSMFYKIKQVNDLKKQYEFENNFKYDFVFRYRFDTKLEYINFNDLSNSLYIKKKSEYSFYDMVYGGNSDIMDIMSNCFNWLMDEPIENLKKIKDAEHMLCQYLKCSLPNININENFGYTFYSLRDGTYTI
jgi:hypothetical protein